MSLSSLKCVPCQGGVPPMPPEEQQKYLKELSGWEIIDNHHLKRVFHFSSYKDSLAFVNRVAALAEEEGHHPEMLFSFRQVTVEIWTHKINGLTLSDFVLASKIGLGSC